jgi:hypothetical protein
VCNDDAKKKTANEETFQHRATSIPLTAHDAAKDTIMNYNQHIKTTQTSALDAYYAIAPTTPQTMLGRDKTSWRALIDRCNYATTEDKLAGGN